jgi:allantoin racemase
MRIAILNPNTTASMTQAVVQAAQSVIRPGTVLQGVTASTGAASIESPADEVLGAMALLQAVLALEASTERPDAYVVACFGDTGLAGVRCAATGVAVGMTEAALMTACLVAQRFTIITMPRRTREQSQHAVRNLGLEHRCNVRAIDEPVAAVALGSLHLLQAFVQEGRLALEHDNSEAIILGCAGLTELVQPLQEALGVPVIEGVAAAVTMAEGLLALELKTSRAGTWLAA